MDESTLEANDEEEIKQLQNRLNKQNYKTRYFTK